MKELLDALMPEKSNSGITITIDINLDEMMKPKPPCPEMMEHKMEMLEDHPELIDKKINMLQDLKNLSPQTDLFEKPCPEMPREGQTISFLDDQCAKNEPCPLSGLDRISGDFLDMIKNLSPKDFDGEGFKKERVEVYPSDKSSSPFSN